MEVLYEDNHLIAINKSCGDIVQGDKTGDIPVTEKVKAFLKEKYNKPGNVFLGLPHRLDRPTSGVLLLAKTGKVLPRLNGLFQQKGLVKKVYWAVVDKIPPNPEGTLEHYLIKNEQQNRSYAYTEAKEGAKFASMSYKHIASINHFHLLEIQLKTGRHHQIRVQLRQLKIYIKGDLKYGFPRSNKGGGISLHARSLEFVHPVKNEKIKIIAPPPKDNVWDAFLTELKMKK